ncbi:MAG: YggS family pyridoxal phosphate-dependent enzyme [Erysipelotrichaceae bacterium]|nr:YggS family pyridoxal phosphate-dependent enzyme [Erysipelotrichaceae bacterium]
MIEKHYKQIKEYAKNIDLCVVSKKRSIQEIQSYYDIGERIFGENRADEFLIKTKQLPTDISWQFIGHLQRNKVKEILPYVSCIQSLDNIPLARVIEKEAAKISKKINVLVELHMAMEDTNKSGLNPDEVDDFINTIMQECPHIQIQGIMAMGPHTDSTERIHEVFQQVNQIYQRLQNKFGTQMFHTLSMGMSHDYQIAIEHGSTMLRIGTYLFEETEL